MLARLGHGHGGDEHVDAALLQELDAAVRADRKEPQLDAQPFGEVLGQIDLEADDLAGLVAVGEGRVVGLDAGDQLAPGLDVVDRAGKRRPGHRAEQDHRLAEEREDRFERHGQAPKRWAEAGTGRYEAGWRRTGT